MPIVINTIFVIIAAIFLPKIGAGIAEMTGLGQTFVGNILIAVSPSLPETVACFDFALLIKGESTIRLDKKTYWIIIYQLSRIS